jgi:hypothetical protein
MSIMRSSGRWKLTDRLAVLGIIMAVVAVVALPAAADIDKNANAIQFGPSVCEDGREVLVAYTPTEQAPVGKVVGTNSGGVAKSLMVLMLTGPNPLEDYLVLETIFDRPGKGLDKNTVWCVWPSEIAGIWVGSHINFHG